MPPLHCTSTNPSIARAVVSAAQNFKSLDLVAKEQLLWVLSKILAAFAGWTSRSTDQAENKTCASQQMAHLGSAAISALAVLGLRSTSRRGHPQRILARLRSYQWT